jgi:hypothetical protein
MCPLKPSASLAWPMANGHPIHAMLFNQKRLMLLVISPTPPSSPKKKTQDRASY